MGRMTPFTAALAAAGMVATAGATIAAPVPIEDLMRFQAYESIILSPGGDYIAATIRDDETAAVAVLDIRDRADIKVSAAFRLGTFENPSGVQWVRDDRLAFTSVIQQGTHAVQFSTGRIFAIDADGRRSVQLYGMREGQITAVGRGAAIIHALPDDSAHILIQTWTHDVERPVAMRLNLFRSDRTRNAGTAPLARGTLTADQQGIPRFVHGPDDELSQVMAWRPDDTDAWRSFDSPFDDEVRIWGFTADGAGVYAASRDIGNLGVFRIDLESGRAEKLLGDDTFEAVGPIWNMDRTELIGAVFATPRPEARFFAQDDPAAVIWRSLQAALPDYFVVVGNYTDDGSLALVHASSDREPGILLILEVDAMRMTELVAVKSWIDPEQLATKQPIRFTARDGLELHGYLTVPPGSDGKDLPLVVWVHGGPYDVRDTWGYDPFVQAFATRGYAVLQVNFRGSGGRGYRFVTDAYRMWGEEMQDDVTDATLWAIEQGIAHPDRVCIAGASYGGYATLRGVTREPDLYRCGFSFVGVYDLPLFKRRGNIPRHQLGRSYLAQALEADDAWLRERSPTEFVERIKADLHIVHGAADEQAHVSQHHSLVRALESAGIPHEQRLVPREGHGFYRLENRVELVERALAFFDRNIGSGWSAVTPDAD